MEGIFIFGTCKNVGERSRNPICARIPLFIDIEDISNEEGFISLAIVGIITSIVGIVKIRHYRLSYKERKD